MSGKPGSPAGGSPPDMDALRNELDAAFGSIFDEQTAVAEAREPARDPRPAPPAVPDRRQTLVGRTAPVPPARPPVRPAHRTEITPSPAPPAIPPPAPPAPAASAHRTEITPPPAIPPAAPPAPAASAARTEITPPPASAYPPAAPGQPTPAPPPEAPGAAPTELSPGSRVNQFELIRELGRGGMGQVYLARDTRLGRLVALKLIGLRSAALIERFLVEARATAQCNHENIVVIYEADEWNGQPYMALEYLEGQSLAETLGERSPPARRAVELMIPVVKALARAHDLGIVHRDLKPDNIFVTRTGVVKVLDFGIAKLFGTEEATKRLSPEQLAEIGNSQMTQAGGTVGTAPYMSPEQWGADAIDHRSDLWAVGIIFWELLAARHPLDPISPQRLWHAAAMLDKPLPSLGEARPDLPPGLDRIVDRCLAKRKEDRYRSAAELLAELEALLPGRYGRRLEDDESPYRGLRAFEEGDADRFFGRDRDVAHLVQRMREQALVGVVGPSGVGKSSFVRAGVVPALRADDDDWEVLILRPGRRPMAGLATLLQPLTRTGTADLEEKIAEHETLVARLRSEPGYLGTLLRSRARQKRENILLFVDQFEELYTLVADPDERRAYTACLAGVADDASTPLRVVLSMRSDFLDRVAEDRQFMDRLTRALLFLPPIDRDGLGEALTQPLEMAGYAFESDETVDDMLASLDDSAGALPLLQFTAAKLWDARDRQRRLLTSESYQALGGVAGALATHADEVIASLTPAQRRLTRAVFERLVTADGTRAVVDVGELLGLSADPGEVQALLDHLVAARLLVVQSRGEEESPAAEIAHESLIASWPALRRWREERSEDSAFLEQLRAAARQWEARGCPAGLLWRGEAMEEARRFSRRYQGELSAGERRYLGAVVDLATRSARRKRRLVVGAFVLLSGLVAAAGVVLFWIRQAEQTAQEQRVVAEHEAERARAAETKVSEQLATITQQMEAIERAEAGRLKAAEAAERAEEQVQTGQQELAMTYEQLEEALAKAERERGRAERAQKTAEEAAREASAAKLHVEKLLTEERARVKRLEQEKRKLSTELQ